MIVVGSSLAGRFGVERLVAHGSMTTVYRALDRETGRPCAVKVLSSAAGEFRHRFLREATVLAKLRHPAIVPYVGHGLDPDGLPYLAMDWLDGEDLDHRLARGPLPIGDAIALGRRVADALAYAHAAGVIHRDIKPGNIVLVDGDPARATVVDFGLARFVLAQGLTRTGLTMGTPGYMAPEQARGARDLDERVDLYSLGCVLFHAIAGVPPYAGEHVIAVLARLLLDEPPSLLGLCPEVPADLDDLVARLMAKDAEQRPRSAAEVRAALEAVGRTPRAAAAPAGFTGRERRLLSLILLAPDEPRTAPGAETDVHVAPARGPVVEAVAAFGGTCEGLSDGTLLALLPGVGTAADAAVRAARCALALRRHLPRGHIALATGWAEVVGPRRVVAEVLDRAMAVLAAGRIAVDDTPTVRVDDVTAGLLDSGFRIDRDDLGLILDDERDSVETAAVAHRHFAGRDRELTQALGWLRDAIARDEACALLVTGSPGIGKSRFRVELVRRLASSHPDLQVWLAHGDPVHAGTPFALAGQLVRRAANLGDADPPAVVWRKLAARVARRLPAKEVERVAGFLAEIAGAGDAVGGVVHVPLVAAARRDPALMADQQRRAWEEWIVAEAQDAALLLVLEDVHWCDLSSLQLVDAALRRLARAPFLVAATARPEVHERVPGLGADGGLPGVHELVLGPLPEAAAGQLARTRLPELPEAELAEILACAEGNPLFLEELCRAVRDRPIGEARAASAGGIPAPLARRSALALPPTLVAVVEARLEALGPGQRNVLRAASVFGRRFWRDGLVALIGEAPAVDSGLAALIERDLVAKAGEAQDEYAFRHATVLEVAYASLTEDDRVLGHRLAGQWLVAAGADDAVSLAEHFDRGGDRAAAIDWYLRAAERSLASDDLAGAIEHAGRAIACGAGGATYGRLRRIQADAELWCGRYRNAESAARQALTHLPPWSRDRVDATGVLAMAAGHLGIATALGDLAHDALESTPPPAVAAEAAAVAARIATYLIRIGAAEAMPLARRLLDGLGSIDELSLPAHGWREVAEATWAGAHGDVGAVHTHALAAVAAFEAAGDRRLLAYGLGRLGHAAVALGDYARAEATLRRALAIALDHGLAGVAAAIRPELARALTRQGALDQAAEHAHDAVDALVAQQDRHAEGDGHLILAEIHLRAGQLVAAEGEAEIAVVLAADAPPRRAEALALLAEVLLAAGEADEALGAATQAASLLDTGPLVGEDEAHVRLIAARALARLGRNDDARAQVRRARRRLQEHATSIEDPALRASYLRAIPVHARVATWEP